MAKFKSEFLNIASERGFIHQCTDEAALDSALMKGVVTSYNGYDCTARSLHVGHLMPMMLQRWFQKCGHRPIVLMGGGTTKVGDPSFRDESRPLLSDDEIDRNIESIRNVFSRLVTFGNKPTDSIMVNNAHWLDGLHYISFLRDIGSHFTISRMLTFDSVQQRLDKGLTFLEFNYMILQAYDFLELKRRHNCILQTGGSDQWGNIVNGVELCRRVDGDEVFGLTTPLLTTSSGAKMGKTAAGAVWLNPDMLKPFDFWQYWRNTEDADVGRFLKLFTELPMSEIARLEALGGAEINDAKKILATEVTALVHGRADADAAAEAARRTFESGETTGDLPTIEIARSKVEAGLVAFQLLREVGVTNSGGEARRLIRGGGVRINEVQVADEEEHVSLTDFSTDGKLRLSVGKKRHMLVKLV